MIRCTPTRVKIATSVPTSSGSPRCTRPPQPAYSPSEFSRTITQSRSPVSTPRNGEVMPGSILVEALADRQPQAPQRNVIRHVGRAHRTEKDGIEFLQFLQPVRRHHDAV